MALFIPRTQNQILRDLISKVIARTDVSDVSVGSTLFTILNAVSLEVANTESRMANIRKGFSLENATGEDLDQRVSELPPNGIRRKSGTSASGSVLKITRNIDTNDVLTIPTGSTVQRGDDGIIYTIPYPVVFEAGVTEVTDIYVVCQTPGAIGNALPDTIDTIVSMPAQVNSVTNEINITNGQDEESDTSLRQRALRYVNSLGRVSKSSLEFLGTSFIGSNNDSFKFASIYEDPTRPAYSELIVDDGTGLKDPGIVNILSREYTIGSDGVNFLTHERPAIAPLNTGNIVIERDGGIIELTESDYISIPERGIVYFNDNVLQADDIVTLRGIRVYQGLIAELQNEIEGNVNRGTIMTGFRAAGCRVRVLPPLITDFSIKVGITPRPDVDFNSLKIEVTNAVNDFVNNLDIGQFFDPSSLTTALMLTQNITSCKLFIYNTETQIEKTYPASDKHVLRIKNERIDVVSFD
jgi:uncharacterized phage protein gp47/JayE